MKILKLTATLLFICSIVLISTSCKKKCKLDGSTIDKGTIVEGVVIYPESGYLTESMGGNYEINASSIYANRFEVSFSQGPRVPVNYANYKVLAFPVTVNCNAQFERTVTVNTTTQSVTYAMTVTQCPDCPQQRTSENYVLVPTFPDTYTVNNVLTVINKE